MTKAIPRASEPLGRFESRLLDDLKLLVERAPEQARPEADARWRPRRRYVIAVAAVAVVLPVATALSTTSIGWRLSDPHKQAIATKLRTGGHLDQLVATDGAWSLYVQPRAGALVDWELSSSDTSIAGIFLGRAPIEIAGESGGDGTVVGRVKDARAASVTIVGRDGRTITVPLHGSYFLVSLERKQLVPAVVVARDSKGAALARVRVTS